MANTKKTVKFWEYCKKCIFKNKSDSQDPCNECMTIAGRENSHKPIKFKERK